ncbi:MAG: isoprenylcysteine carboxylmethyltransferase family protein [Erysipelotrichaceae bacterium]|nr:isoprenylcysteine carboxylmethyltransferase family protein [Erysipelotrichaceae bacterium]
MKDGKLLREALVKYLAGIILVAGLLFVPAGSLKWKEGWLFMGLLFVPMFIAGIVMYLKAPDLLRSRLNAKEKEMTQKSVIGLSGLMFLAVFVLAGLNQRFGWIRLPAAVVVIASIVFLLSYLMFAEVLRENAWLSRTIEVVEDQKVVDSGLYGIVRHPMYTATVFLFLSMPLILNSLPSFVIMLTYIPLIVKRIFNEEEVLQKELKGYSDYCQKVKYRLVPFIW